MIVLNFFNDFLNTFSEFIDPIVSTVKDLWYDFSSFFLRYMSEDVFNILVFGIVIALVLIIVLAVINKN